jgi:putative ABC transport system permease protein
MQVLIQAWLPTNFGFDDMELLSGRALTAADQGQHRAVLGSKLADNMNKKVGDTITILQQKFEIVGVFKTISVFETGGVVVLMSDYQELSGRKGKVTGFSLRVKKSETTADADVEAVRQQLLALQVGTGKRQKLSAERPQKYLDNAAHLKLVRAMAWMVSAIGILIGVISMLNTMVMSVLERTQEIGILRAVGWPRGRVVRMVLLEAVTLGVVSALVGAVGAFAVTHLLALSPTVNGFIEGGFPLTVAAQGVAIAAMIGLLGGAYPAIRAAQLLPTEAIRHD